MVVLTLSPPHLAPEIVIALLRIRLVKNMNSTCLWVMGHAFGALQNTWLIYSLTCQVVPRAGDGVIDLLYSTPALKELPVW